MNAGGRHGPFYGVPLAGCLVLDLVEVLKVAGVGKQGELDTLAVPWPDRRANAGRDDRPDSLVEDGEGVVKRRIVTVAILPRVAGPLDLGVLPPDPYVSGSDWDGH